MFKLDEALEALLDHEEFAVKDYDGLVCLDYILCFPGTFDCSPDEVTKRANGLWQRAGTGGVEDYRAQAEADCKKFADFRRNFRGVTFSKRTGEICSLPLHKFYNINQTAETQFDLLSGCTATIYEKMDGSMIHFFVHPDRNELQAATCRSTQTPQAQEALAMAKKNPIVHDRIHDIIAQGWTPVFEFVAAHNQIVVQYPRPRLVYLISRNRATGEYRFDEGFPDTAGSFQFPFTDINKYLDKQEFEGYVCHLSNGMIVKAKTPWYMERHRAVDALMRPAYKLYQVVFDGVMDDLIPTAPDRFKPMLTAIYEEAQRDLLQVRLRLERTFEECLSAVGGTGLTATERKDDKVLRKAFVQHVQANFKEDFSLVMALYVGNDPSGALKERLMEGYKVKYPNRLFADLSEEVVA